MDPSGNHPNNSLDEGQSLENSGNTGESLESPAGISSPTNNSPTPTQPQRPPGRGGIRGLWDRLNVYLLLFVLLIIIAGIVTVVSVLRNNKSGNTTGQINSQNLSTSTLQQLANNSVTVGGAKQLLNIESDTVFAGGVLVRGNLQVAGTITAGGSLSLPGISVSGESTFGQIQAKTLALTGNAAIQGQLTVQSGLSVNGNGTFSGTITAGTIATSSIQLNGTLTLLHHIAAGGSLPSRVSGSALGSGGTSSVSGSDTAGSITISTGSSPAAGCFITVSFTQAFSATPHVVVTPIGSAAAGLAYYVNRSTTNFSVCTASTPSAGQSFGFDYIVFD